MSARNHSVLRPTVVALALTAVAFAPFVGPTQALAESSAPSSTRTSTDFTAGIRSIDHGLGLVTLVGTAPVGSSVEVGGDVVETVWTEADANGSWTAGARLQPGDRTIRLTSAVSGQTIDIPVRIETLLPPEMVGTVDGIARTIALEGTGHPGARFVVVDGDRTAGETRVGPDGTWTFTLRDLTFGDHHVEAWQYFDGTHNGGVDEVYTVSGAPVVTESSASRQTDRITLAGRAPADTTLTFADADGPVLDGSGDRVTIRTAADSSWRVELPIPDDARLYAVTVTAHDGATELGAAEVHVTVPIALTGTVEEQPDGSIRLSGTGENGGEVSLEREDGTPIEVDGAPVTTTIARSWELTVARDDLPADVVVARQRVDGVEQGALRLVLPSLPTHPVRPAPGAGTGGVETGTHPDASHASAARITAAPTQLAYTGTDPARSIGLAAALLLAGLGGLSVSRTLRRR